MAGMGWVSWDGWLVIPEGRMGPFASPCQLPWGVWLGRASSVRMVLFFFPISSSSPIGRKRGCNSMFYCLATMVFVWVAGGGVGIVYGTASYSIDFLPTQLFFLPICFLKPKQQIITITSCHDLRPPDESLASRLVISYSPA